MRLQTEQLRDFKWGAPKLQDWTLMDEFAKVDIAGQGNNGLYAHPSSKKKDVASPDKTPVHTINVQSMMTSVGESRVVYITSVDTCRPRNQGCLATSINRNVMLLQQFLPATSSQASSSSFSRTVPQGPSAI